MEKTQHTPGPWEVIERRDAHQWPEGYVIKGWGANVLACVYDTGNDYVSATGQANAQLIAAAPDLLEALNQSNDAMNAAYVWIAKNTKDVEGAAVIGAMLQTQHTINVAAIAKATKA